MVVLANRVVVMFFRVPYREILHIPYMCVSVYLCFGHAFDANDQFECYLYFRLAGVNTHSRLINRGNA